MNRKNVEFLITFRRRNSADDSLIALSSKRKLLWWMLKTGIHCDFVLIQWVED